MIEVDPSTGISGAQIVDFAAAHLGDKYAEGAEGPTEFDCSGLVQSAYRQAGITLPRVTHQQVAMPGLQTVSFNDLQPGDLIFSNWIGSPNSHVGLYAGNGRILEAGDNGVAYSTLGPNYRAHITAMKRVPGVTGYADATPISGGTGASSTTPASYNTGSSGGVGIPGLGDVAGGVASILGGAAGDPLGALNRIGDGLGIIGQGAISGGRLADKIFDMLLNPQIYLFKIVAFNVGVILMIVGVWMMFREIKD